MKKILFVSHSAEMHGAESVLISAITHLVKEGHEAYVIIPDIPNMHDFRNALPSKIHEDHIFCLDFKQLNKNYFQALQLRITLKHKAKKFAKFLRPYAFDFVYTNSSLNLFGSYLAQSLNVPYFWHFHETMSRYYDWPMATRYLYRSLLRIGNPTFIFISYTQKDAWEKELNMALPISKIIYNPYNTNVQPIKPSETKILTYGFIGKFIPRKNIEGLLTAFQTIHNTHANVRLICQGGNQEAMEKYQALVDKMNLSAWVELKPYSSDTLSFYSRINVMVIPSWKETMPLVSLEAMSMKIPTIHTSKCGMRELFADGHDLLFINPKKEGKLEKAMLQMLDTETRQTLSANAYNKILNYRFNSHFQEAITQLFKDKP